MTLPSIKTYASVSILGIVIVFAALLTGARAEALSGSDFDAGRIIDDSVFFDQNAITPDQIQSFLNSKVPTCDTNGTGSIAGTTRAQYGADRGNPPPYTCLKDYTESVPHITNGGSDLCTNSISAGTKTAATILYDVGQACGINPQALIVLIQKEQGLITDEWPWQTQYDKTTGYGCPDTAPCNEEYFGFFNQVYQAAKAFRRYEANPNSYNFKANRNNAIRYHPNVACGSSNVFIENQATANLYIYTPYQPNQSALDNLYGSGDSCGAYGNRNFWRIFHDWFGNPVGAANYSWSVDSQRVYTDASKTTEITDTTPSIEYGEKLYTEIVIRNDGNRVWDRSVRIGTVAPRNHKSTLCDSSWIACSRPTKFEEETVAPGETATFGFYLSGPTKSGTFTEAFSLLKEGILWFPDAGLTQSVTVTPPPLHGQFTSERFYTSDTKTKAIARNQLKNGLRYYVVYSVKNTGTETWSGTGANAVILGSRNNTPSQLCDATWPGCARPAALVQDSVAPGETGTFEFWITTPFDEKGTVLPERFRLLIEGATWFPSPSVNTNFVNNTPLSAWSIVSSSTFLTSAKTTQASTEGMSVGEKRFISIQVKNLSGKTWNRSGSTPLRLSTHSPRNNTSPFCDATWLACARPAQMVESSVAPGDNATFEFWVHAKQPITKTEKYILVSENAYWLGNAGLQFSFSAN